MPLPDPREGLNFLRECTILEGHLPPSIMRAQAERDATILIGPLRVVIHRLSLIADAQHKRHCLAKSTKFEGLRERISFHSPARQIRQGSLTFSGGERYNHALTLPRIAPCQTDDR